MSEDKLKDLDLTVPKYISIRDILCEYYDTSDIAVIHSDEVTVISGEVTVIKDKDVLAVREYMIKTWRLDLFHGFPHWDRVYRNVLLLSDETTDLKVAMLFAYFHDSCRTCNNSEPDHGPRAAEYIDSFRNDLLKNLTDDQIALLKECCRLHTSLSEPHENNTVNICCDADRLDLWRDGVTTPLSERMLSIQGKNLCKFIFG